VPPLAQLDLKTIIPRYDRTSSGSLERLWEMYQQRRGALQTCFASFQAGRTVCMCSVGIQIEWRMRFQSSGQRQLSHRPLAAHRVWQ
jgi:hypothetical protein